MLFLAANGLEFLRYSKIMPVLDLHHVSFENYRKLHLLRKGECRKLFIYYKGASLGRRELQAIYLFKISYKFPLQCFLLLFDIFLENSLCNAEFLQGFYEKFSQRKNVFRSLLLLLLNIKDALGLLKFVTFAAGRSRNRLLSF